MEGIIIAVISLAGVAITAMSKSNKRLIVIQEQLLSLEEKIELKTDSLSENVNLKIETLTDRVEKHNNVIERMYAAEKEIDILKEVVNK